MSECQYKPGDLVTVQTHWYGPIKILTVKSVKPWRNKFKITTSDGGEWESRFGRVWGSTSEYYTGHRIRPTESGDAGEILRKRAINVMCDFDWKSLSNERLFAVAEIVAQHNKEAAEARHAS